MKEVIDIGHFITELGKERTGFMGSEISRQKLFVLVEPSTGMRFTNWLHSKRLENYHSQNSKTVIKC